MARPQLTLVAGGVPPARTEGPEPGAALEFAALALGLTLSIALLAHTPAWFWNLGAFQTRYALACIVFAAILLRARRYAALPHIAPVVLVVAFACRSLLAPLPPSLSGDLHRYLWEGRVINAGGDPYHQSPADTALAPLRDDVVWPQVNHRELSTIYPPLAEAGFALVARLSPTVTAFKVWVALHDLALVVVLLLWARRRGITALAVIAYAWNPMVLIEYAGNGHNDPTAMLWLAIAFLTASRRPTLSALALSAAVLTKLAPLVALPFLLRVWPWRARAVALTVIGGGLAWFWLATRSTYSGLSAYWGAWRNNELVFHYLDAGLGSYSAARTVAVAAVLGTLVWAWWRRLSPATASRYAIRAGVVVTPVLHPWYLGWELMFQPLATSAPWLLFAALSMLNYGVLATPAEGRSFHLPLVWRWLEYGLPALLAVTLEVWRRRRGALAA